MRKNAGQVKTIQPRLCDNYTTNASTTFAMARSSTRGTENSSTAEFPTDQKQLVARLEQVFQELSDRKEQKEEGRIDRRLHFLKGQLIRPHVLGSKNRTVRQLAGRSIVHLLFLYAPELPYNDGEVKRIFICLVQLLKGIELDPKSSEYLTALEILEKLALYRMSCMLIDVADSTRDSVKAEEIIVSIFDTVLDVIGPNHPHKVDELSIELLSTLIEEHDQISPKLIDAILCRLLPERRNESEKAYTIASKTVKRCADCLREPISAFVNNAITGGDLALLGLDGDEADMSELKDHIHDLIYALHEVDPSLTLYILPNVANQLEVDDFDVRFKAVQLMCLIFHSSSAAYATENERLWTQLMRRIRDKDSEIRYEMVKFAGYMVSDHQDSNVFSRYFIQCYNLADAVELSDDSAAPVNDTSAMGEVRNRLSLGRNESASESNDTSTNSVSLLERAIHDSEEKIREEAVLCIVEHTITRDNLKFASSALLRKMAARFHDKNLEISSSAAEGLGKAFAKHVVPVWLKNCDSTEVDEKLGWIPDTLLKSYYNQLSELDSKKQRLSLVRIIDEYFLGKKLVPRDRAILLSKLWATLSHTSQTAMRRLCFEQRLQLQQTMQQYLDTRNKTRDDSSVTSSDDKSEKEASAIEILNQLSKSFVVGKATHGLSELQRVRDQYVFRDLKVLCSPKSNRAEIKSASTDLYQRLGTKSDGTRAVKSIVPRMSMLTVGVDELKHLLTMLHTSIDNPVTENVFDLHKVASLCALLKTILITFPDLSQVEDIMEPLPQLIRDAVALDQLGLKITPLSTNVKHDKETVDLDEQLAHDKEQTKLLSSECTEESTNKFSTAAKLVLSAVCRVAKGYQITSHSSQSISDPDHKSTMKTLQSFKDTLIDVCTSKINSCCQASTAHSCTRALVALDHNATEMNQYELIERVLQEHNTKEVLAVEDSLSEVSLSTIAVLLLHTPGVFVPGASGRKSFLCPNRIVRRSVAMTKAQYVTDTSPESGRHAGTIQQQLKLKLVAIKVVSSELIRRARFPPPSPELRDSDKSKQVPSHVMVVLLRKLVSDMGDPWSREKARETQHNSSSSEEPVLARWPPPSAQCFAKLRTAASNEILRIMGDTNGPIILKEGKSPQETLKKRAQRWVELSWIAMDPSSEVRDTLAKTLVKHILVKGKQPFFLGVFLVLVNGYHQDAKNKHESSLRMSQLFRSLLRKYTERVSAALDKRHEDSPKSVETNSFVTLAPECMLPNLVFLLAHHPALPTPRERVEEFLMNQDDQRLLVRPIVCLLDALLSVNKLQRLGSNANSGILFAMLNAIRKKFDLLNPTSNNIHVLCDLAAHIIRKRVKLSSDGLDFQGNVPLPPVFTDAGTRTLSSGGRRITLSHENSAEESYLPPGFELAIGVGSRTQPKTNSATAPRTERKMRLSTGKVSRQRRSSTGTTAKKKQSAKSRRATPTRKQPRRSSKGGENFVGYKEVESDIDMINSDDESRMTASDDEEVEGPASDDEEVEGAASDDEVMESRIHHDDSRPKISVEAKDQSSESEESSDENALLNHRKHHVSKGKENVQGGDAVVPTSQRKRVSIQHNSAEQLDTSPTKRLRSKVSEPVSHKELRESLPIASKRRNASTRRKSTSKSPTVEIESGTRTRRSTRSAK